MAPMSAFGQAQTLASWIFWPPDPGATQLNRPGPKVALDRAQCFMDTLRITRRAPRPMLLEATPQARDWLQQFHVVDQQVARQLLRRLTLVSQSDFDQHIQALVEDILARNPSENFALLTVSEPPPGEFEADKERRVPGSSADRIKHIIENLSRVHGNRVRADPTVESMRADRIRNVLLVEDFIGSGDRITGYWRERAPKSIKSWISYGWTRLWVAAYAVMDEGLYAMRRVLPIDDTRIATVISKKHEKLGLTGPMALVAQKYGERLVGRNWRGYSGGGGLTVFQHGCPNNTPAILWYSKGRFKPLFPDRGIPPELQKSFGQFNLPATAEDLWTFKQYRLALSLLDRRPSGVTPPNQVQLAIALGLASAYGRWNDERLQTQMTIPIADIRELRFDAYRLNLIEKSDHRLTAFGRALLDRMREPPTTHRRAKPARTKKRLPQLADLYYPSSYGGVARD